jgi:hypothetical protein
MKDLCTRKKCKHKLQHILNVVTSVKFNSDAIRARQTHRHVTMQKCSKKAKRCPLSQFLLPLRHGHLCALTGGEKKKAAALLSYS